jgi:hypothetical protein
VSGSFQLTSPRVNLPVYVCASDITCYPRDGANRYLDKLFIAYFLPVKVISSDLLRSDGEYISFVDECVSYTTACILLPLFFMENSFDDRVSGLVWIIFSLVA